MGAWDGGITIKSISVFDKVAVEVKAELRNKMEFISWWVDPLKYHPFLMWYVKFNTKYLDMKPY